MMYREVDMLGIFLPGLLVVALAALVMAYAVGRLLGRSGFTKRVWHPELFNIAVFVLVFAALAQTIP
ncbi:DUF1656 domain-containing protein [Rhizobium leguminosarum]|uniref:DUF1656 domain-containing protein n=1 Tax=Rhizobium leguminosarum TaxID=384 RepID=UPI003D070264